MKEGGGKIHSNDMENKSEKNDNRATQKKLSKLSCSNLAHNFLNN